MRQLEVQQKLALVLQDEKASSRKRIDCVTITITMLSFAPHAAGPRREHW